MIKTFVGVAGLATAAIIAVAVYSPSKAKAQGGTCFPAFNQEIASLTSRKPLNNSWGTRDTFQWSYFIGEEGINILMKYQSCMDPSDFASNFQALDGMRDKGRQGCQQTSTDPSSCVPRYPGE